MEYEPVCGGGSNGTYQKTFDNMCALKSHACNLGLNITKVMDGPCRNSTGEYCCVFLVLILEFTSSSFRFFVDCCIF